MKRLTEYLRRKDPVLMKMDPRWRRLAAVALMVQGALYIFLGILQFTR